ncbi:MAG: 50S ribosomal protein L16 [Candidatus Mesenet longicola]|uniref:50S ribosomal protein L16 n=1 Tax=Candidatus Mesenet longicola TaxID=1892558 RepID=A0A8J3MQ40_9RICK|nr:MAG: 50S ribosomal protein L16 [Candidatus Mesenet longicola]GHM59157.1 MAG: 50S ribosomal protein L16 [Candidatus Mesenet longicola]
MFIPRKTKYKKIFKGRIKGNTKGGNNLVFGDYGLKAIDVARINSNQIEAARRTIVKVLRSNNKKFKLWIKIFPNIPVSKKPADVRMGKGKGSVEFWAFRVNPGRVLFEVSNVPIDLVKIAFDKASSKLPVRCKFVSDCNIL